MKVTIGNKRYNSEKCEVIGTRDHYSHSNNFSGSTSLLRAADGQLLLFTQSNGQDFNSRDSFSAFDPDYGLKISDFEMNDVQEARAAELKLIEII